MLGVLQAAAAGAAEDGDDEPAPASGPLRDHPGGGLHQHVGGLERLDPADEQQHVGVGGQSQPPARRPAPVRPTGGEDAEVDPGRHDRDLAGVRAVEGAQLVRLVVGVRQQPAGGRDHLLLPDQPAGRLRCVALGEGGVLDPGHGVHRVDQRHVPAVGGQPADLAGEPVVGVHEVVPAGLHARLGAHDTRREGAQLAGKVVLRQSLERPGSDVPHQHPRRELDARRLVARGGPGEDLDLGAPLGHPACRLDDVHVHPPGIPRAGLLEGGGVHGEHRHPRGHTGGTRAWQHRVAPKPHDTSTDRRVQARCATTRRHRILPQRYRQAARRPAHRPSGRPPCRLPSRGLAVVRHRDAGDDQPQPPAPVRPLAGRPAGLAPAPGRGPARGRPRVRSHTGDRGRAAHPAARRPTRCGGRRRRDRPATGPGRTADGRGRG